MRDDDQLFRTIESEIIPRLMLSQVGQRGLMRLPVDSLPGMQPTHDEVLGFCDAVLSPDDSAALRYIGQLRAKGFGLEALLLNLMAPTARRLGELWTSDALSFTEVTVGLSRMQNVLRELSLGHNHEVFADAETPTVMFLPVPGEQHTFGVMMVEELFRRSGFNVVTAPLEHRELMFMVKNNDYDILGFSISCEQLVDKLTWVIRAARRASRNRDLKIMVGGRVFVEHPELVKHCGADATAIDGPRAVQAVRTLTTQDRRSRLKSGNAGKRSQTPNGDTRQTP
jgi:methanogenic corrinoid protein MtbC1